MISSQWASVAGLIGVTLSIISSGALVAHYIGKMRGDLNARMDSLQSDVRRIYDRLNRLEDNHIDAQPKDD